MDMEFKLFGLSMEMWKLHNPLDYALFIAVFIGGICMFVYVTKRMAKGRNDIAALNKVLKKLNRLCKGNFCALKASDCIIPAPEGRADLVLIAPDGVHLARCIGWGFKVSGAIATATWKVADNSEERRITNPISELTPKITATASLLRKNGLDVPVTHMIVFADPYSDPRFSLEYGANAMGMRDLKKWYRSLPTIGFDAKAVKAVLTGKQA